MPSLNALGQFKSSFNNIANEKADIESLHLKFDDLKLPTKEAPPIDFKRDAPFGASSGGSSDDPLGDILGDLAGGESAGDFDIGSFMDSLPEDSPAPIENNDALSALGDFLNDLSASAEAEAKGEAEDFAFDTEPSFEPEPEPEQQVDSGADDDPFAGLLGDQDETSAFETEPDFGSESDFGAEQEAAPEEEEDDFGGIDLGGESPFSGPSTDEAGTDEAGTDDGGDDFNFGNEDFSGGFDQGADEAGTDEAGTDESAGQSDESFDAGAGGQQSGELGDFEGGIDLGGESLDFVPGGSDGDEAGADDFSLDGFSEPASSDFDSGFDTDASDASTADEAGTDADFSDDFGSASESSVLDLGDLGDDFASGSIELDNTVESGGSEDLGADSFGSSSFGDEAFGSDDFTLSGLDDLLNKSKSVSVPTTAPKKGFFARRKEKAAIEETVPDDNIEEISLSQDDVDKLMRTLASYPLNLRIACEELIAEQVILPQQLSMLIRLLVYGAHVKETAAHVESIIGKPIIIPKSFEKGTGAAFEAEQSSFAYIFVHNFLPVFKLFAIIAALAASVIYLGYNFIYIPITAENLYKRGYERIHAGEYQRANDLFHQAFSLHKKKKWFYSYAEAFRDHRRYTLAEGKYDELLRHYPRDKKGILDYANLNTYYIMNYSKANDLLQRWLLDFAPNDIDGLFAAGDNFLAWADSNPSRFYERYEDARFCYARLLELRGWQVPIVERMLKYFIRTDNLREVLNLRAWFDNSNRRRLSAESLSDLGGYLLDKQLQRPSGVPDPYIESIESVRAMLLQAVMEDPYLPEPHYHLARYHNNLGNIYEERLTLENAIRAFELARRESVRRRIFRVDTHYRYANVLINNREFFPAEENVVEGIKLFEDFSDRHLMPTTPQLGQLYALHGDLEYFVKTGNMEAALTSYRKAESFGYAPPEVQYRMGAAYYQQQDWRNALEYLFKASADLPLNRRLLFALGNAAYQRGDYFAAQGYYNRLLDTLELQRNRLPVLLPNESAQFVETGERLMMARNNLGVVNEALANQTGNREYRSRAMAMYAESSRAWDAITRNPQARDPVTREPNPDFMTRMRLTDSPGAPSINLGYLNSNNALRPTSGYSPQIFVRIDKDVLEPSKWEELAPLGR